MFLLHVCVLVDMHRFNSFYIPYHIYKKLPINHKSEYRNAIVEKSGSLIHLHVD